MAKQGKGDKTGKGDGNLATVERLDAYVSIGTKSGLGVWSNKVTWQSLFGYVPHFVEQLNTHRGVLEFLGGTFRDKKNGKLINPPQAFFSHQMEQMRGTQQKLSQEMSAMHVRLQEEQRKREIAEHRTVELEAQLNDVQRFLASQGGQMLDNTAPPRRDYIGGGYGLGPQHPPRQATNYGGYGYKQEAPVETDQQPYLQLPPVDSLATRTNEFQNMAASLLAQGPAGPPNDMGDRGRNWDVSNGAAEQYMRLLGKGDEPAAAPGQRRSNDGMGSQQQLLLQQLQLMQRQGGLGPAGGSGGPMGIPPATDGSRLSNQISQGEREDLDPVHNGRGNDRAYEQQPGGEGGYNREGPQPAGRPQGHAPSPQGGQPRGSMGNGVPSLGYRCDGSDTGAAGQQAGFASDQATALLVQEILQRKQWEQGRQGPPADAGGPAGAQGGSWGPALEERGMKRAREEEEAAH